MVSIFVLNTILGLITHIFIENFIYHNVVSTSYENVKNKHTFTYTFIWFSLIGIIYTLSFLLIVANSFFTRELRTEQFKLIFSNICKDINVYEILREDEKRNWEIIKLDNPKKLNRRFFISNFFPMLRIRILKKII